MKKIINVGDKVIGDGKITIQSMTNTATTDIGNTVAQIRRLADAGADFVRVSIPDKESAYAIKDIVNCSAIPLIGDIHFNYEPALIAIENGISKIRINPSNFPEDGLQKLVNKCRDYNVAIRVGVNRGSVRRNVSADKLVDLTLEAAKKVENCGWDKIVLAVKSSSVSDTVKAYRRLSSLTPYPLHIGLTEAGIGTMAYTKSTIAIGALLFDGIGDTIRVSLTGDPVEEVYAAKNILRALNIDRNYVEIISCPTCARTCIDVEGLADRLTKLTSDVKKSVKIAVMGCVVNGIGEGQDADFGVAGGKERSVIFKSGKQEAIVDNDRIEETLIKLLEEYK